MQRTDCKEDRSESLHANQLVVECAEGVIIDIDSVFIVGLIVAAFDG